MTHRASAAHRRFSDSPRATPRIGAILLAAGSSTRAGGENKLLMSLRGEPLARHAAQTISAAMRCGVLHCVRAVCGRDAEKVQTALAPFIAREFCAVNAAYQSGIASSLQCGLRAMHSENADGVLVMLGDMPRVSVDDIRAVIDVFAKTGAAAVVPVCDGRRGNPALLSARLCREAMFLRGDVGARALFAQDGVVEAPAGAGVLFDVDSPRDMAAARI